MFCAARKHSAAGADVLHHSRRPSTGLVFVAIAAFVAAQLSGYYSASSALADSLVIPVALGSAGNFSVLAASAVTNTGGSVLANDLGVTPGASITGFPPGRVDGSTHRADTVSGDAKSALLNAYRDAASRQPSAPPATSDYQIGSMTFGPGVWASTTSIGLYGDVILDAKGNSSAVFIFQAGSTLITAASSRVLLVNGARSENVFWQVGSSATIGASSKFAGTIMAYASVTVSNSASIQGRALAKTGAVTLDNDTFDSQDGSAAQPIALNSSSGAGSAGGGSAGAGGAPASGSVQAPAGPAAPVAPADNGAPPAQVDLQLGAAAGDVPPVDLDAAINAVPVTLSYNTVDRRSIGGTASALSLPSAIVLAFTGGDLTGALFGLLAVILGLILVVLRSRSDRAVDRAPGEQPAIVSV